MERHGHDSVGRVESLLDTVPVMNVDVDVQYSLVILEQLEDPEDDVVYITKTGSLALLGVMETAAPIYADLGSLLVQLHRGGHGTPGRQLTKLVQAIEDWTVFPDID